MQSTASFKSHTACNCRPRFRLPTIFWCAGPILWLLALPYVGSAQSAAQSSAVARLADAIPDQASGVTPDSVAAVEKAVPAVQRAGIALLPQQETTDPSLLIGQLEALLQLKAAVDRQLEKTFALRGSFVELPRGESRRQRLRNYLRLTAGLIDLSARLRYLLSDATRVVAYNLQPQSAEFQRLLDMLLRYKSSITAAAVMDDLFIPPRDDSRAAYVAAYHTKFKIVQLAARSGERDRLKQLARFVQAPETPPGLVIYAADALRQLGLPQAPRPGRDPTLPDPEITAAELSDVLAGIDAGRLRPETRRLHAELLEWIEPWVQSGLPGDTYRLGKYTVRAGDWLLMKNPSPYNRFTDLSPGLFTHVGIITTETGSDGIRRMVLVDIPERSRVMRTIALDTFVKRTLHYVVLRHQDPAGGKKMAEVARSIIGNRSQFDLNFRTSRVEALQGQPLKGRKIHTYCAGLLLLAAQETGYGREAFFPIPEYPAPGHTVENLATLGLSFGKNFISPTGALFSPHLEIVARREAMYNPRLEIEEAVFDHFARRLVDRKLTPSQNVYQALRQKIAEASEDNPLLKRALTQAAGVDDDLDVVSAAKAAAVIETLDEIAHNASAEFNQARSALLAGSEQQLQQRNISASQRATIRKYRQRHAQLYEAWRQRRIDPRSLRLQLVRFYTGRGQAQLDDRYFSQEQ